MAEPVGWYWHMKNSPRHYTTLVLEAIEDGRLDPKSVAEAMLAFFSEDDIKDFVQSNDLQLEEDVDYDDDEDSE